MMTNLIFRYPFEYYDLKQLFVKVKISSKSTILV